MPRVNFFDQGRLTRDPETRELEGGILVTKFTIAIDRYKGAGERETDFLDCIAWRSTAERIVKFFKKGSPIFVQGRIRSRRWTNRDGVNVVSWELDVHDFQFVLSDPNRDKAPAPVSEETGEGSTEEVQTTPSIDEVPYDPFA